MIDTVRSRLSPQTKQQIKRMIGMLHGSDTPAAATSSNYRFLEDPAITGLDGWQNSLVAQKQHGAFQSLLTAARNGAPRLDFVVAAQAVMATYSANPLLVEVGCGSGYYSELLPLLTNAPLRYVGVDYAIAMTDLAHTLYPQTLFLTGDACLLPLADGCCDILLSGTSLMHIRHYAKSIAESARVSRQWCIFHTVPVMAKRSTALLQKNAYGEPVIEIIFNQLELETHFRENNLVICDCYQSIPYDVSAVVGEPTWTVTYLCKKV